MSNLFEVSCERIERDMKKPDMVESIADCLVQDHISLMNENESLRQQLDHIKQVDFPRKVEAVSNGWRTRLDAERIVAKERFEKLLSWVDAYCEVDDKDFAEIEPVVNAVLGEAIETNPLSELRQQLADQREAFAVIAETPVSGEQDDITMEAKDRIAKAIRAWEPKP